MQQLCTQHPVFIRCIWYELWARSNLLISFCNCIVILDLLILGTGRFFLCVSCIFYFFSPSIISEQRGKKKKVYQNPETTQSIAFFLCFYCYFIFYDFLKLFQTLKMNGSVLHLGCRASQLALHRAQWPGCLCVQLKSGERREGTVQLWDAPWIMPHSDPAPTDGSHGAGACGDSWKLRSKAKKSHAESQPGSASQCSSCRHGGEALAGVKWCFMRYLTGAIWPIIGKKNHYIYIYIYWYLRANYPADSSELHRKGVLLCAGTSISVCGQGGRPWGLLHPCRAITVWPWAIWGSPQPRTQPRRAAVWLCLLSSSCTLFVVGLKTQLSLMAAFPTRSTRWLLTWWNLSASHSF